VLNIYSARTPQLIQPLLDAYTQETGVEFKVLHLSKGMAQRLAAEGDNTPADIVLTVDISRLAELDEMGIFAAVDSPVLKQNIPAKWRDPDAHWFGLSTRARVAVISAERVNPDELKRIEDLADDRWHGRVCTRKGSHPYNRALLASLIAHNGEAAAQDWAAALVANMARKPQGNDRDQVKAIYAGVCDLSIGNHYYYFKMMADPDQKVWLEKVSLIFPNQDSYGSHVNISGIAIINDKNYESSLDFLKFLLSDQAQEIYANDNNEFPVNPNVSPSKRVQALANNAKFDSIDLQEIASNRKAVLEILQKINFDS